MVSFFERNGCFIRCETREGPDGTYEIVVTESSGEERVEQFASAKELDARLADLENYFRIAGWYGPYGRRS